ncbi:MAG TPA: aldo/keto reductase [Galbitalea sp.]|nr:aldo/keto reductase [Galbitalea sp.]
MELHSDVDFGTTGLVVSNLSLGTSNWGPLRPGETPAERDFRIAALADRFFEGELGITSIDTSNLYGGSLSEGLLGDAIRRAGGVPSGIFLQTKLDRRITDGDFSGEQMWRSLNESLQRLGLERIAVLYLHDPEVIGFEAAMAPGGPAEALFRMKDEGLAERVGISGGPVGMLRDFVETGRFDALVTHNRWTLLDRSADGLLDAASRLGMGITNAAPYGGGVLTGDRRFADSYGYRPIRPEIRGALDAMRELCGQVGVSLPAAALQFSLRDSRIHSTIVGASDLDRYGETLAHVHERIPEELWARLDGVAPPASSALDTDE